MSSSLQTAYDTRSIYKICKVKKERRTLNKPSKKAEDLQRLMNSTPDISKDESFSISLMKKSAMNGLTICEGANNRSPILSNILASTNDL